jgi:hypothetical protein
MHVAVELAAAVAVAELQQAWRACRHLTIVLQLVGWRPAGLQLGLVLALVSTSSRQQRGELHACMEVMAGMSIVGGRKGSGCAASCWRAALCCWSVVQQVQLRVQGSWPLCIVWYSSELLHNLLQRGMTDAQSCCAVSLSLAQAVGWAGRHLSS